MFEDFIIVLGIKIVVKLSRGLKWQAVMQDAKDFNDKQALFESKQTNNIFPMNEPIYNLELMK